MKTTLKIIAFLLITLMMAEGGLRVVETFTPKYAPGNESGKGYKARAMSMFLQEKINKLWMRPAEDRKTILEPPFQVFVNKKFQDQERMQFIFEHASLPPNLNVTAENFLRLNHLEKNETFTVTTNSLSFRGKERKPEKSKNTFRVIVLGSYPAFGHAVNDDETYSNILEKSLSEKYPKKTIEIWNGGRQGGTSIMGYARLIKEISKYSPDLVLWDYGWIELYLSRDRVKQNGNFEAVKQYGFLEQKFFSVCIGTFLSTLKLCKISVQKMTKISYSDAIAGWQESMNLVMNWAKDNKVPVYFLRHKGVTIPAKEYEVFHHPENNFHYVDTSPAVEASPTAEEITDFWSRPNWLTELGFEKEKVMKEEPHLVLYGDAIQYNKHSYKRIGLFLSGVISERGIIR